MNLILLVISLNIISFNFTSAQNSNQIIDTNYHFIKKFGTEGSSDGQFIAFNGIAVDSLGNVYITDNGNGRVQKFDSNGNFIAKWNTLYSRNIDIAIDSVGNVYVTNGDESKVQVFDSVQNNPVSKEQDPAITEIPPIPENKTNTKVQNPNTQYLNVTLNSVEILPINDELRLQLAFDVYNPNREDAILEYITFNVYLNDLKISSGDIGSVAGLVGPLSPVYTLIGNQTITLRSGEPLTSEASAFFDAQGNLVNGESSDVSTDSTPSTIYDVNGTFVYSLNKGNEPQKSEQSFSFQYSIDKGLISTTKTNDDDELKSTPLLGITDQI